jgi:hypothetical protein
MGIAGWFERRSLLKAAAALGGILTLAARSEEAAAQAADEHAAETKMADIPLNPTTKITVERRGQVVLIGINRPYIYNRIDPEASRPAGRYSPIRTSSILWRNRASSSPSPASS